MSVQKLLLSLGFLLGLSVLPAAAQVRVLIDATADGGVWWSPQSGPYDPNLPHQGKALADYLKGQGLAVTELAPGTRLTCDHLSATELVIVPDGWVRRTPSAISAYTGYVANGGRLILLNDHHAGIDMDSISLALGLDFTGSVNGPVTSFAPHAITSGVTSLAYLAGSTVARAPASATILGSIAGQPVMGVMPFGYGRVFFIGDTNGIEGVPQPFTGNLVEFMKNGGQAVNACATDLVVDFGASLGVWRASRGGVWSPVHALSPEAMATGDFDGNGFEDLLFDFGPSYGVWAWMNHTSWVFVHPLSPTQMAVGDLDDNGRADALFVFAGAGIWRWHDGGWTHVHSSDAARLAVGHLDSGFGPDDLIADFPGFGIYILANNSTWRLLHPLSAAALLTADLDGNGQDEIVIDFTGFGLFVYRNNSSWTHLSPSSPTHLAAGRLDAAVAEDFFEDLVGDFGSSGLWVFRNNASWALLHPFSAEGLYVANRDGSARDEIIVDFGAPGIWQFANGSTWSQIHPFNPDDIVAGRFR